MPPDRGRQAALGERLVALGVIDRVQLLRALRLQDRNPYTRLGECIAALGLVSYPELERIMASMATARRPGSAG